MATRRKKRLAPGERFITWHHWMLNAPAFRALSGNAVKLMTMLHRRYNGNNNGAISMSVREGAHEIGCSVNHAQKCFRELEAGGFIEATLKGSFTWKSRHATTWRLTWLPMDNPSAPSGSTPASKEFMRAKPPTQN